MNYEITYDTQVIAPIDSETSRVIETEAEYIVKTEASKEIIWLQRFLKELRKERENSVLHCDSQSAIHLAKNSVFHSRIKHLQVRYHFIRSLLENGMIYLEKISGSQHPADMLTKAVTIEQLKLFATSIGLQEWA